MSYQTPQMCDDSRYYDYEMQFGHDPEDADETVYCKCGDPAHPESEMGMCADCEVLGMARFISANPTDVSDDDVESFEHWQSLAGSLATA
jgi:hypothetical protein